MSKPLILVIEDNADTRLFLQNILANEFEVLVTENAHTGINVAKEKRPDLVLLDVVLPTMTGFDACAILKKDPITKHIPIIFLSVKNTVNDIIQGLNLGADDYVTKPFDYRELLARMRARLRERMLWMKEPKTIVHGDLRLVLDTRDAFFGAKMVDLTETEFDILRLLIQKSGEILTRDQIIDEIWKEDKDKANARTIDVHIRAIRKKIPLIKRNILSIYGSGYKYER